MQMQVLMMDRMMSLTIYRAARRDGGATSRGMVLVFPPLPLRLKHDWPMMTICITKLTVQNTMSAIWKATIPAKRPMACILIR
jgi:hypothetical protein